MIGLIFKLLLLSIILYGIMKVFNTVKKIARTTNNPLRSSEMCPACHRNIQVSGTDLVCPHCETKLARNKAGKLLIRVN